MAPSRLRFFLAELRRRKVIRVALAYAIAGWLVVQGAASLLPLVGAPEWVGRAVLLLVALGYPLALALSWAYDATPAGLVRAQPLAVEHGGPPHALPRHDAPAAQPAVAVEATAPQPARPVAPPRSVAVLPFVDMSAEQDQEHFSDGIAEEVLNVLAHVRDIRVAARTSSFAFKGRGTDVRRIGEELGVASVVEGSVRKAGNRVRVTVQLIDAASGYHLWSERYDRELEDVFAIQDEIAGSIAGALDVKLVRSGQAARAPTEDVQAYDLYLRARHLFHQIRRHSMEEARRMFLAAVERDPRFAMAYAGAANCSCMLHMYWDHKPENLARAERDSRRALELGPDLAEAHCARGLALSVAFRYAEAEVEFERALAIDDRLYDTYYFYARSCWAAGKLEKAAQLFLAASELRPEDFESLSLLQSVYRALGRAREEHEISVRGLERIERHLALYPNDVRALYLGAGDLVRAGETERGLQWATRALALDPDDCATRYNVACFYALLRDADTALAHLEAAIRLGYAHREWIENDGDFALIRDDPRFEALLSGMHA